MAMKPAVFLDKDGTLLVDEPYNMDPQYMRFAPGAAEGLAMLAALNWPLIVVSNQPGLALGRFDFQSLRRMRRRLSHMFEEVGATMTAFYFCPHDINGTVARYAHECGCRKPAPGLLLHAARRHDIDLPRSWMIGDILNDVEAGQHAGCSTVLIDNGNETEWVGGAMRTPHFQVSDLLQAAHLVTHRALAVQEAAQ